MSAPQITEEAGELGSLTPTEVPVVGPTESWPPRLASVTPIPANEDTGPVEPVTDDPEPDFTYAPHSDAPTAVPQAVQTPPSHSAAPQPAPMLSDPRSQFKPFPMERLYPVIYWTSVAIGLVSQVIGWGTVFGGTLRDYVIAAVVGGICELTMVAASDKALNRLAENRGLGEAFPFLAVSTIAAHIAVGMVATHWEGSVGIYLAVVSAAGFLGHMLDGGFKAARQRKLVQDYERQVAEEQERAAAEAERQRQEAERQRQAAAEAEQQRREAAEAERRRAELAAQIGDEPPRPTRKGQKITKEQAFALGVHKNATTPAAMRNAISAAKFAVPSETSVKNYAAEVKKHLG